MQLESDSHGKVFAYHKELQIRRALRRKASGGCDDWQVGHKSYPDGTRREFVASATAATKPVWVDKLFSPELKALEKVAKEKEALAAAKAREAEEASAAAVNVRTAAAAHVGEVVASLTAEASAQAAAAEPAVPPQPTDAQEPKPALPAEGAAAEPQGAKKEGPEAANAQAPSKAAEAHVAHTQYSARTRSCSCDWLADAKLPIQSVAARCLGDSARDACLSRQDMTAMHLQRTVLLPCTSRRPACDR